MGDLRCVRCKQPIVLSESFLSFSTELAEEFEKLLEVTGRKLVTEGEQIAQMREELSTNAPAEHAPPLPSATIDRLVGKSAKKGGSRIWGTMRRGHVEHPESDHFASGLGTFSVEETAPDTTVESGLVSVSDVGTVQNSLKVAVGSMLFELASEKLQSDHPVCSECSDLLLNEISRKTEDLVQENSVYRAKLEELRSLELEGETLQEVIGSDPARQAVRDSEAEEAMLIEEARELQRGLDFLRKEAAGLEHEAQALAALEESYWTHFNEFQNNLFRYAEERDSLMRFVEKMTDQLDQLNRTNVYNDCFHIWYDGHFGTINGFRLGRLPSQAVEWTEINAAFGQSALLLVSMARSFGFVFKNVTIQCMGGATRLARTTDVGKYFELYSSGDPAWRQPFASRRFDTAITLFLDCVLELGQFVEGKDPHFGLPYEIERGACRIGNVSAKYNATAENVWTKAMKYVLTDLKFLLIFLSRVV